MTAFFLLQTAAEQLEQVRQGLDTPLLARMAGVFGLAAMIAIAWLLSSDRRKVNWRLVGMGVVLQAIFAVIVLKTGVGRALFTGANTVFVRLLGFTRDGASFIFGNLVNTNVPVGVPTGATPEIGAIESVQMWANTGAGVVHSLAYNMVFIASVSTILFNANPLLRFDGYYILSDLLDMPNLHGRAAKFVRHLVERHAFGWKKSRSPAKSKYPERGS